MEASVYLTVLVYNYLLWAFGIYDTFISDSFPILSIVFTFGFPIAYKPDDSIDLTELILIGELLNYSYLISSSSSSSTLKASVKMGWFEFLEGWGILNICLGHCPN